VSVAFGTREMPMRRIVICVLTSDLLYFPTLSHKRHDFRKKKKKLLNVMCVLIFSTTFVWNILILRGNERDLLKMSVDLHVKCPLFLSDWNKSLSFLARFSNSTEISNLMKIRPVGAELFHADRRTDRVTDRHDDSCSSQFYERPKRPIVIHTNQKLFKIPT